MQIWKNKNSQKIKNTPASKRAWKNTSFSNSHQHSYFELKVLAGLNQERTLSSAFDKLLLHLCGKNQTHLYQAVSIRQKVRHKRVFFRNEIDKKNFLD